MDQIQTDLAQITRLALAEQTEDVRLFVARLVRKYRNAHPELAKQLDLYLRTKTPRSSTPLRRSTMQTTPQTMAQMTPSISPAHAIPVDDESRLSLLKVFKDSPDPQSSQQPNQSSQQTGLRMPLLSQDIKEGLHQLIEERRQSKRLAASGLTPARSAIFVGKPGVGKTLTARWLAAQLGLPLYILDLTAVMSSLLGRSGNNLRTAIDFAKRSPCVLLLDEIDAIAKRRSDDTDIGELKRLVTVILQEVDEWPATGLLLAATNHPELIDPALWRRFDLVVEFKTPDKSTIKLALKQFLGPDSGHFSRWIDILAFAFNGESFSDIEREIHRFRRAIVLSNTSSTELIEELLKSRALTLDRHERIDLAVSLAKQTRLSQHTISSITGVSRDTIRKYLAPQRVERKTERRTAPRTEPLPSTKKPARKSDQ